LIPIMENEAGDKGIKLALVMGNNVRDIEKLGQAVEGLGYRCVSVRDTEIAIGKMKLHNFDLMILSDQFDSIELLKSPVFHYLNHLSMSVRRRIFICLIGDGFETMDNMMAFSMSANLVVNWKDIDKLPAILKRSILENGKFYKVFIETLQNQPT